MNFLAHVYLSGNDRQLAVGNFLGDFVKGKQYENYPVRIREGILLHRKIDTYTDAHLLTIEARAFLRPVFGRYSGIYLDVFYDYFLASNWADYHKTPLRSFSHKFYWAMVTNYRYLPSSVKSFLPNLIVKNRLYSYANPKGIYNALKIMSRYSSLPDQSDEAIQFLEKNKVYLKENFTAFFADLEAYVSIVK